MKPLIMLFKIVKITAYGYNVIVIKKVLHKLNFLHFVPEITIYDFDLISNNNYFFIVLKVCCTKNCIQLFILIQLHFCLQYQGDEKLDTDIPTYLEAKLFNSTFGKFIWVLLQPFFYALRPMFVYPKNPTLLEIISVIIQLAFNYWVYLYLGKCVVNNNNILYYKKKNANKIK